MKLKLDTKTVAGLALAKGRVEEFAWDAELEGFGLRLRRRSDGALSRNWVTQYRANGHTRRVTIGSVDRITPAQARDAARKTLARVELGHDPQGEKQAKRQQAAHTVRSTVDAILRRSVPSGGRYHSGSPSSTSPALTFDCFTRSPSAPSPALTSRPAPVLSSASTASRPRRLHGGRYLRSLLGRSPMG
jgi:Arm DNA-binding domain